TTFYADCGGVNINIQPLWQMYSSKKNSKSVDFNLSEIDTIQSINFTEDSKSVDIIYQENIDGSNVSCNRKICHKKSKSTPIYFDEDVRPKKRNFLMHGYWSLRRTAISGTDQLVGAATKVAKRIVKYGYQLLTFKELPDWLKDNHFIHRNHRPELQKFKLCFRSIFSIHTETGNIWTHLIGLILLLSVMIYIFARPSITKDGSPFYPSGYKEILCYTAFFLGGSLCLMFSTLFHTLCCHSQRIGIIFAKLDYSGIAFLICGAMIPVHYYSFYCNYQLQIVYISVAIVMSFLCILASLLDIMSTPTFRPVRAIIFLSFGLSSIIPIVHNFAIYPSKYSINVTQIYLLIAMGSCYVLGCLLYMFLIPERLFPGKLSIAFQSHQIFHVLVVIGTFIHLYALCRMSAFRVIKGRICYSNETNVIPVY
ncbi:hypothetical protein HZS_2843, partial [Henneguya salminicola]